MVGGYPASAQTDETWEGDGISDAGQILFGIKPRIHSMTDGIWLRPNEYARLLSELTSDPTFRPDSEGQGGVIEELQAVFAAMTGKAKAIYMPSGTMANQLAIRVLAEGKSKVYVQDASHVLNNEGDAAQELHHKRLMPLAPERATFSLEELSQDIDEFRAREIFRTEVGAISIENPVKARHEEVFDIGELRKISKFARDSGLGLHLDGARLHMASAYSGISVREYASLFDTVYLSLYKYFGAAAGAVLCGPADVIDRMPHLIKIAGGNMATNWATTSVALHFARNFENRYAGAVAKASKLFGELNKVSGIRVEPIPNGSNVYKLSLENRKYAEFVAFLDAENVLLRGRSREGDFIPLKVNETVNLVGLENMVSSFQAAYVATL